MRARPSRVSRKTGARSSDASAVRTKDDKAKSGFRACAWWTVALLCTFYVISYIDRIIPSLLVTPLKEGFGISDVEFGLLFGGAFAVFYGLLGLPIARAVDRGNRKHLIFAGVMIWSACTFASGLATAFWMLVILRMGLAIGEAVLSPAAYSMIGDFFPPERRALPAAIYAAAGNIGTYGAYIAGAGIFAAISTPPAASFFDLNGLDTWQMVFFIVGLPGILVALIFLCTTYEPSRRRESSDGHDDMKAAIGFFAARIRLFGGLFIGASFITVIIFAYGAWAPEFLHRTFGWSVETAGLTYGATGVVASALGTLFFTQLSEFLIRKGHRDGLVIAALAASALGCVSACLAALMPTAELSVAALGVMIFSLSGCSNVIVISNQFTVPSHFRATAIAIMFMCTILIGLGIGPPLVAWLAEAFFTGEAALGPALALVSISMLPPSAACLLMARKVYIREAEVG
ncbi:MAG: hypothetical protein CME85_11505 [Henriciella sp.]|jgi:MFS family permease|uniref:MFS transporter n=1 Tax=Henriciella sp. TaxID=1968823 RepID=UPI000C0F0312|nr:MFS transporter [Henriciella sp.]MBF34134.1 hypothetical protein [Hyphomonadaceae bacterium]MBK76104.1 hypothetical protein [Henriciella sp.]PHR77071.1 MAG: hypothetical protein COA64_09785 [Henriciella sp.]